MVPTEGANKEILEKNIQKNISTVFNSYSCVLPEIIINFKKVIATEPASKHTRIIRDFQFNLA